MTKPTFWRRLRRDVVALAAVLAATFTAKASVADQYYVPSGSMLPTVHIDDRILVNKAAYGMRIPLTSVYVVRFGGPSRGDVVVLSSPEDGRVLLKRVVALPGDEVRVLGGQVVLNGEPVAVEARGESLVEALGAEPHLLGLDDGGGPSFGPVVVPEDRYLVLGDNRGQSHDGRMFGFVPRSDILGKAQGVFLRSGRPTWISL